MSRTSGRPSTVADGPGRPEVAEIGRRLRDARVQQSIGLRELGRRLSVSASMISQIETGRVMPSVSTLYAITSELGVSLDELFARQPADARPDAAPDTEPGSRVDTDLIQHAVSRTRLGLGSGVHWERLTVVPDADIDFLYCTYDVGSESAPPELLQRHGGHEYGFVEQGRLGVTVGFETYELAAGDSISFSSSIPHRLFNLLDDRPSTAVWFVIGRSGDERTGS